jgi:ATP synthase protein I
MSTSDDGDKPVTGHISQADREAMRQRSEGIGQRLGEVKARRETAARPAPEARGAAYGQAFRIAAELIAGLVFGGALGWFLDRQFDTLPLMLVLFVMIGFAAGLLNVIRGARAAQARAEPLQRSSPSVRDDDDDDR